MVVPEIITFGNCSPFVSVFWSLLSFFGVSATSLEGLVPVIACIMKLEDNSAFTNLCLHPSCLHIGMKSLVPVQMRSQQYHWSSLLLWESAE
jgi:hypothetical protein